MDPEVLKYFKKIMNSFSLGLLWLLAMAWAGLGFRLAIVDDAIAWYNLVFYVLALITFALLIWFFYRVWK